MNKLLIKNATLVNEGRIYASDVLIEGERIARIAPDISAPDAVVIDAAGRHLIPGMIDDQVHFREPVSWKCPTSIPRPPPSMPSKPNTR